MKKILVVDDEILVRIGIKTIVVWEEYGYTLIGEAGSGREAMEKIRREQPDIVLTDLVMENGDGFELMRWCAAEFPNIRFVVLSGYDDLEHVKKAMKLGAADYIFKLTMNPKQVIEILDGIRLDYTEKNEQKYEKLLYKNREAVKTNLLEKVGLTNKLDERSAKQLKQLDLQVDFEKKYQVLYLSVDNYVLYEKNQGIDVSLLKFAIENISQEVVSEKYRCETFDYKKGDLVIFIQEWKSIRDQELEELFLKINKHLDIYFNVTVSGSAMECGGIQDMAEVFRELENRIQARYLGGKGGFYWEVQKTTQIKQETVERQVKQFRKALEDNDFVNGRKNLAEIYTICQKERLSAQLCRIIYFDILGEIKESQCLNKYRYEYRDQNGYSLYDGIMKYELLYDIHNAFFDFFEKFMDSSDVTSAKYRKEILDVKAYVRENLGSTLNVSVVAKQACMSENYFSHIFKKETGTSFVDYVNKERIEAAKRLLCSTDDKIYEISEKVGISSSNYFGILFKRLTGITPNEYRETEKIK